MPLFSISLKPKKGSRLYLKSYRANRKDGWTTQQEERYWTESWDEIEDIYHDLVARIERYETRATVTSLVLVDYLGGQNGTLEILETRERPLTRRSISVKP